MNSMRIEGEQKQDEDTEDEAEVVEHKHVPKTPVKPRVRRSYGARVHQGDEESEEDSLTTYARKKNGAINNPFTSSVLQQPTFQQGPMTVSFIQQKSINSFNGLPEADPSTFLKDYEKMATAWSNKAKVDNLGQY
jgi:hypothetical protein